MGRTVNTCGKDSKALTIPDFTIYSEQYYGELDLDAFKKSQLILGNIGGALNQGAVLQPQISKPASPKHSARSQRLGVPPSQVSQPEVALDEEPTN